MAIKARHLVAPLALVGGVTLASAGASAGCDIPFRVNVDPGQRSHDIFCEGPHLRRSCFSLAHVEPGENRQFYCAEDTIFHPWGDWTCSVRQGGGPLDPCNLARELASTRFNLQVRGPNPVNLRVMSDPTRVSLVGAALEDGAAAGVGQAASFLGHADGDMGAGGAAGGGQPTGGEDIDTWGFEAAAGKTSVVRLEGDDTAGYAEGAATLRLES